LTEDGRVMAKQILDSFMFTGSFKHNFSSCF